MTNSKMGGKEMNHKCDYCGTIFENVTNTASACSKHELFGYFGNKPKKYFKKLGKKCTDSMKEHVPEQFI